MLSTPELGLGTAMIEEDASMLKRLLYEFLKQLTHQRSFPCFKRRLSNNNTTIG